MAEPRIIPWKRIGVEAAAIVASILSAFAIDAWWDARVDLSRSKAQLRTLEIEFGEVEAHLQQYEVRLLNLRQAVSDLLSHIGSDTHKIGCRCFGANPGRFSRAVALVGVAGNVNPQTALGPFL